MTLVAASALVLAGVAEARPRVLVDVPAAGVGLRGDGERFSAWSPGGGEYPAEGVDYSFLRDSRSGRTRRYTPPRGCRLGALAAGVGVIGCAEGHELPRGIPRRLVRLETRRTFRLKTSAKARRWLRRAFAFGFGRHWLRMQRCVAEKCEYGYVNWRTGEVRRRDDEGEVGPNPRYDLDSPDLQPFERKVPRVYYGMTWDERGLNLAVGRRVVTLDRCPEGCLYPQLGAGLVTWANSRMAFGYRRADGRRFEWRFDELTNQDPHELSGLRAVHTASEALFAVPAGDEDGVNPRTRIYLARR